MRRTSRRTLQRTVSAVVLAILAQACASVPQRSPLPQRLLDAAVVAGIDEARFWGDELPPCAERWLHADKGELAAEFPALFGRPHHYLAISGGSTGGAFGAGILVGWTQAGTRPEFSMVTGVSIGALIAPFAFLGPDYDPLLEEIFTSLRTEDLFERRKTLAIVTGDAIASSEPLAALIRRTFDPGLMAAVAAEHRRGRILAVGTTHLDAERPMIWNLGRIAASGAPGALELIHRVLLASASVPAAVPPVLIEVEAEGRRFDELHVDGGTVGQVFLLPPGFHWQRMVEHFEVPEPPRVYVVRNARLVPQWQAVENRLRPLAERSIDVLIRSQGLGDVERLYWAATEGGLDFHLVSIPEDFDQEPAEFVDPEYMRQLFELGRGLAAAGDPWEKAPPGLGGARP